MEYRYCPNMIVIDTPGMLHPPKGRHLTPQQRALAQAAKEAELLVLNKIKCEDYIILCVEDTTDWKHATTRNVVTQVSVHLIQRLYIRVFIYDYVYHVCVMYSTSLYSAYVYVYDIIYKYVYHGCAYTLYLYRLYMHIPYVYALPIDRWTQTCPAPCS